MVSNGLVGVRGTVSQRVKFPDVHLYTKSYPKLQISITLTISCLSFLLSHTNRTRYRAKKPRTVEKTAALLPRSRNLLKTVEKSIVFGGTKNDAAKDER